MIIAPQDNMVSLEAMKAWVDELGAIDRSSNLAVLLVDDEDMDREFLLIAIEQAGMHWNVIECSTGEDAIRFVAGAHKVELVFVDIGLSGVSGFEVIRQCNKVRANVRCVIYTGGSIAYEQCVEVGAFAVLTKPPKPEDIIRLATMLRL